MQSLKIRTRDVFQELGMRNVAPACVGVNGAPKDHINTRILNNLIFSGTSRHVSGLGIGI